MTKRVQNPWMLSSRRALPDFIKVEESLLRFGVDPRFLKPSSERMVVTDCANCLCEREKKFRHALKQRLCTSCANRMRSQASADTRSQKMRVFYASGGRHPLKGIGHTAESRAKMSAAKVGVRNVLTEAGRASLAEHCRRTLCSPERLAATSEANRIRFSGKGNPGYGKPPRHTKKIWYDRPDGNRVCFRSNWEALFAGWLDARGLTWTYEADRFPVTYCLDGVEKEGTYIADFRADGVIYEVKGRWTKEGQAKWLAFNEQYPDENRMLIDRSAMKYLGLIR